MNELLQIGISGWEGLLVILVVMLVVAWRLIVYANSSADSPYVEDLIHEASGENADHGSDHQ
jgi:hypothetical protein